MYEIKTRIEIRVRCVGNLHDCRKGYINNMFIEITNNAKVIELFTWYKIQAIDGSVCPDALYMRIKQIWDTTGIKIFELPKGSTGIVDIEYSDMKIP